MSEVRKNAKCGKATSADLSRDHPKLAGPSERPLASDSFLVDS